MSAYVVNLMTHAILSHALVDLLVHRLVWVVGIYARKAIQPCVRLLLAEEAAEGSISAAVVRSSFPFESAAVLF